MKHNFKKYCNLLLCLFIPFLVSGANEDNIDNAGIRHSIDSIHSQLTMLEGEEKLQAYEELYNLFYLNTHQNDSILHYIDLQIEGAQTLNNVEREGEARLKKMVFYYNEFNLANFEALYKETRDFYVAHGQWDNYAKLADLWLPLLCSQALYQRQIEESQTIYNFSKENNIPAGMGVALTYMGQAYYGLNDFQPAEKSFQEGILMLKKADNPTLLAYTYQLYIGMLQMQENYEKTIPLLAEWEETNKKNNNPNLLFQFYIQYAQTYLGLEEIEKAGEYIRKAEEQPVKDLPVIRCQLYEQKMNLYEKNGRYDDALLILDSLHREIEVIAPNALTRIMWHRTRIAEKAGNYPVAIQAHKELHAQTDSVWKETIAQQLNTLRTEYEVERHILEKERNRDFALLALAGFVMALLALIIWIVYSRRLRKKNRLLFRQLEEKDRLQHQEAMLKNKQEPHIVPLLTEQKPASHDLFDRLEQLMTEKQLYTQPNITRKTVAAELFTNENYIFQAIRDRQGISFTDYINNLRLEHARKLLYLSKSNPSIEEICQASGFGTRRTFSRLFGERYGMSPSEFRRIAREEGMREEGELR